MKVYKNFTKESVRILKAGGVGVIPTDTLYGVVAQAFHPAAVERVYQIRRRTPTKPFIILISSSADLTKFSVVLNSRSKKFLAKYWPGEVSVILPCKKNKLAYLHRGTNSLAFRVPGSAGLREFLKKTGPLIAPSANIEGKPPAKTIGQAKKYFGGGVDFYLDAGRRDSKPSTLVRLGKIITVIRQGSVNIDK